MRRSALLHHLTRYHYLAHKQINVHLITEFRNTGNTFDLLPFNSLEPTASHKEVLIKEEIIKEEEIKTDRQIDRPTDIHTNCCLGCLAL